MSEDDDEDLARDIEGNVLIDPDCTWKFFGAVEQCPNCEEYFWIPSELEFHEPCFNLPLKGCAKCPVEGCTKSYFDLTQLRAHHNDCHELVESFYCSKCVFRCCSFRKMVEHKQSVHQADIYYCSVTSEDDKNVIDGSGCKVESMREQGDGRSSDLRSSGDENIWTNDCRGSSPMEGGSNQNLSREPVEAEISYDLKCGRYRCTGCHEAFNTVHKLILHDPCFELRGSSTNCPECDINFSNRTAFKIHLKDIHNKPRYFCSRCHSGFKKEREVKEHAMDCFKHPL